MSSENTTSQELFSHLFEACNILRGPINQDEYKSYVTPILFFKRLPMTPRLEKVFNSIPRPENKESLVFLRDYKPLRTQTINDHLRAVCKRLDIRYLSSHKIRAWGITESLASGMDQVTVMKIAGHSTPQTMRHYVRTSRIQKDITEKFGEVFN